MEVWPVVLEAMEPLLVTGPTLLTDVKKATPLKKSVAAHVVLEGVLSVPESRGPAAGVQVEPATSLKELNQVLNRSANSRKCRKRLAEAGLIFEV